MKSSLTILIVATVGVGIFFFALSLMQDPDVLGDSVPTGSGTAIPTVIPSGQLSKWSSEVYTDGTGSGPLPSNTIYTASEAVSRTLEGEFPSGFTPTLIEVRLVSYDTLMQQFHGKPPEYYESDLGPIWLVGILAEGVTNDDILPRFQLPNTTMTPPDPVPGAYYAWDASSAFVTSWGALSLSGPDSMEALQRLPNEVVPIVTATRMPTLARPTPRP